MVFSLIYFRRMRRGLVAAAAVFYSAFCFGAEGSGDHLEMTVILTRHGVRTPLYTDEAMKPFASKPWPTWEVPPGILTPRGQVLVGLMGDYYHALYKSEGLLSGEPVADRASVFVRADNDQRTVETAKLLGSRLAGVDAVEVNSLPAGKPDPLFQPVKAGVFHPDVALGVSAVMAKMNNKPEVLSADYRRRLELLEKILYGPGPVPADSPFAAPSKVEPGEWDNLVRVSGPLRASLITTESLLLEYSDGKPLDQVGWGQISPEVLKDVLELHSLYFDLTARTLYPAQVQGSNLAFHILRTLEQGARRQPVAGALGTPSSRIVVICGHDTNLANLGGLLGLTWSVKGAAPNPVLPGGALVFELWRHADDGRLYVRSAYVSQTLAQLRSGEELSLKNPPSRYPILVPGCDGGEPDFDAPLDEFESVVSAALNPGFILPDKQ